MKTGINLISRVTLLIVITAALIFSVSCSDTNNTNKDEKKASAEKSQPKAPAVDIHTATFTGDLKAIQLHIQAGTDLNSKEPAGGSTALITAVVFGKTEVAKALIEGGADLNISNNDGSTPLYCAAFFGRTELAKILIDKGADKSIRNNFGSTALESVTVPFEAIKGIYDQISKDLGPMGLKLDYDELQEARVEIATLLN